MPTAKKRINITLSKPMEKALYKLAKRDAVPEATKAADLLSFAIEIEEDILLGQIAGKRDSAKVKFISHKKAWR